MTSIEVFRAFLRLGLTGFGGPVAHLARFRADLVQRRGWLPAGRFEELVALCQMLPGPASSQVGMAIGRDLGGVRGALAAWLGFTLPSALLMAAAGLAWRQLPATAGAPVVHALKLVAFAVVVQATWQMARALCPDAARRLLALATALAATWLAAAWSQPVLILAGCLAGALGLPAVGGDGPAAPPAPRRGRGWALAFLALLALALVPAGPGLAKVAAEAYRAGALVFGGGHVVLPLLEAGFVGPDGLGRDAFLAGYGLAQAMPGPLFSVSAYLGAAGHGPAGALVALLAMFLPAFLLVFAALPGWDRWRRLPVLRRAVAGANAAVVGLLAAALANPLWPASIHRASDLVLAAAALLALRWLPAWSLVLLALAAAWAWPGAAVP